MGGKGSKPDAAKGSVGSALTHHRSGSTAQAPPSALSPRHAAAVDGKLLTLDQVYSGIAASVLLSKNGELMFVACISPSSRTDRYARGLDAAAASEVKSLFPRFVTCLSGFGSCLHYIIALRLPERSLDDADVRYLHIYGTLRCFSCFRIDDKVSTFLKASILHFVQHFLLFFTAPVDATPRSSTSAAMRSIGQHTAAQDEKVKQLCIELRQIVGEGSR